MCVCACLCIQAKARPNNSLDKAGDKGHREGRPFGKPLQQDAEAVQLSKAIHQVHKPTLWTYETPILPQWKEGQHTGTLKAEEKTEPELMECSTQEQKTKRERKRKKEKREKEHMQ